MIGTCRPQCQNYQASVLGLRGNGNYLLEAHSCQCMHHFSTHYNIQVTLPPILLGKLKTEPKSTFHTLFRLSATSGRGCISWNNWILLLLRAEQNNAGRDVNPSLPPSQTKIPLLSAHSLCSENSLSHFLFPPGFHGDLFPLLSSAQSPSSHSSIHPGVISVMRSPCNILASEITDYEKRPVLF